MRRDEPLKQHSQYGIGGPADFYKDVADDDELARLLRAATEHGITVTIIGAGSNTLISDDGIAGLVIKPVAKTMREIGADTLELSGGYMLPRAALDCAKLGISGLEFGIGIPGTCGASVRGNAGCFGREIKDVLLDCTALSPAGEEMKFTNAECGFSYRESRFKHDLLGYVITSARFRVTRSGPDEIRRHTDEIQAQRKSTQPYGVRSIGSVFTNPAGDKAGRLIEAAGLKGRQIGGAQISPKHANFIVNVENATAADVMALVELAENEVERQMGVHLVREIVVLGR